MTELCFACDGKAVVVRESREVFIGDRSVVVDGEFMRCSVCGEIYFLPEQADALQRAAADQIRREDGLLTPTDVRTFRALLRLTQAEFEKLLGVGPKTVVRWERGTVTPSRAVDTLLRILMKHREPLLDLARERGVELPSDVLVPAEVLGKPVLARVLLTSSVREIRVEYAPALDTFALSA
jgi:putative zinc finger/helix-turn-helix YgiT family protein